LKKIKPFFFTLFSLPSIRKKSQARKSGNQDDLPRGLIARAECYRRMRAFSKARENLDEAKEIAETGYGRKKRLIMQNG